MIALIQADADPATAWQLAAETPTGRVELMQGLRWLPAEAPRAALYQRVRPLLTDASSPEDVRQAALESIGSLDIRPRETFEALADFVAQDRFVAACVPSLCHISREHWTAEFRQPLAAGLIRHVSGKPLAERTSAKSKQAIKLVEALAELLPSDRGVRAVT